MHVWMGLIMHMDVPNNVKMHMQVWRIVRCICISGYAVNVVKLHMNACMYGFKDVIIESILITKFICLCSEATHLLHDYCIGGIRGEETFLIIYNYIFVATNSWGYLSV